MPDNKPEKARLQRTCVACRQMQDKRQLCRVVRTPAGEMLLDEGGRMAGRGAYVCKNQVCLQKVFKSRALERALKKALPDELKEELLSKYGTTT